MQNYKNLFSQSSLNAQCALKVLTQNENFLIIYLAILLQYEKNK